MELGAGKSGQSVAQHRAEQQGPSLVENPTRHLSCISWRPNKHTSLQFYVPDEDSSSWSGNEGVQMHS